MIGEIIFGIDNYIKNTDIISTIIFFALVCFLTGIIMYILNRNIEWWYVLLCGFYFTMLAVVTIFSRKNGDEVNSIHTIFRTWRLIFRYGEKSYMGYDIAANILMFIPEGFILSVKCRKRLVVVALCFLTSLSIECVQLCTGRGLFEFADLLDNVLGGLIGIGVYYLIIGLVKKYKWKE